MTQHNIKRVINQSLRNTGRFPSLQDVCTALDYTEEQSRKSMQALLEDGYVIAVGDWYGFPDAIRGFTHEEYVPDKVDNNFSKVDNHFDKVDKEEPISEIPKIRSDLPIKIIQLVMGVIGIGATIISIYFTFIWLNEFMPVAFALLLSSIMVLFSVAAFEVIVIFLSGQVTNNKLIQIGVSIGFIFLWLSATSFSVMSTIGGQVNKSFEVKAEQANNSDANQWKIIQEQKKELSDWLEKSKEQVQALSNMSKGIDVIKNKKLWYDTQYKLQQAQASVSKTMDELNKVREQEKELVKNKGFKGKGNDLSFYEWLGNLFGLKAEWVQFAMCITIPIFCDLIAPTALAIALFLKKVQIF